jgi:aquaporin Z
MNKYVMELIGSFFLVLTFGLTVIVGGSGVIAPLAIGSVLMVMVFAGGHISGGHYNPAITLGVWLRGGFDAKDVLPYMGFQVIGAVLAAFAVSYLKGGAAVAPKVLATGPALLAGLLFTFALVFVVLSTATSKDIEGNSFYGLAIGFTVLAGAFAVGSISSAAFNPAVAVGISVMRLAAWSNIWVYWISEFLGGALAAYTFRWMWARKDEVARPSAEKREMGAAA